MGRLTDADALKSFIRSIPDISGLGLEPVIAVRDVLEMIDHAPTIDAIPVEWLKEQFYDNQKSQWAEKCRDVYTKWQKWQRWQKEQEGQDGSD